MEGGPVTYWKVVCWLIGKWSGGVYGSVHFGVKMPCLGVVKSGYIGQKSPGGLLAVVPRSFVKQFLSESAFAGAVGDWFINFVLW